MFPSRWLSALWFAGAAALIAAPLSAAEQSTSTPLTDSREQRLSVPAIKQPQQPRQRIPARNSEWTNPKSADPSAPARLPLDREAGEIRFGDGVRGRRPPAAQQEQPSSYRHGAGSNNNPGAGQKLKMQPAPMKIPPRRQLTIPDNKPGSDRQTLEQKQYQRRQQQVEQAAGEEDREDEAKEQMDRAKRILEESQEQRTQSTRGLLSD